MTNPVYDPATGTPVTITNSLTVANGNPNGQALSSASSPVVLASDQSPVATKSGFTELASLSAGSLNADLVPSTDVSAYKSFSLLINGTFSGTLSFQCSNDNSTFESFQCYHLSNGATATSTTASGVNFAGYVAFRWLRVRMTAYTSGTATGVLELYNTLFAIPSVNATASQSGNWTVLPGNTQNTTPWLVAGPNANGAQLANTAGNVVIKGSSGWLYHAIITTLGAAGLTIFDNASTNSGTPLLVIPASAAVGTIYSFPSGARAVNGIVSAGVTNCPAVTFHYT